MSVPYKSLGLLITVMGLSEETYEKMYTIESFTGDGELVKQRNSTIFKQK